MRTLSGAEFADLLANADLGQAGFARLAGISPRQVNKWCRGHAAVPRWAAVLALAMRELSAETLMILLEELQGTSHRAGARNPALGRTGG
jgi:transcriptional regulator with XRE-family HTH domain